LDAFFSLDRVAMKERPHTPPDIAAPPDIPGNRLALIEKIAAIMASVPSEEWEKLPTDLAVNHDHYLYGMPKRSAT
jgi:hypothetical protein